MMEGSFEENENTIQMSNKQTIEVLTAEIVDKKTIKYQNTLYKKQ